MGLRAERVQHQAEAEDQARNPDEKQPDKDARRKRAEHALAFIRSSSQPQRSPGPPAASDHEPGQTKSSPWRWARYDHGLEHVVEHEKDDDPPGDELDDLDHPTISLAGVR